ncbi:Ribose-5-phosphate isomerase B, putative [Perkinsus marinus ATCC 50983]|uniref:Ribose-5-phosphate isomerase B, putative n=1 Tax=Perkinsus marinus (strain ATCC 50983 / TXsc) TaxID=423536 RepID=C5KX13_PERM5|nr:Ribose-5-phosphate isomerase B, putative [Perkinsus marinus ATCC 50983]EER11017.1 Ribose-5-phosphate isomerase B, putative [Perkinsus marinus ATCC 50983]|eukprot:XP_002779222.1 Ribose-5-phosphate isomerase B, putative [Perkinsus marinus ATCC 50983]
MEYQQTEKLLFAPAAERLQKGLKLVLCSDHAGIDLKNQVIDFIKNDLKAPEGCIEDVGCFTHDSVDYPDFAEKLGRKVVAVDDTTKLLGIAICGSGLGMSISVNKVKGIRCGLCHGNYDARYLRMHNNGNVLAMGGRTTGIEIAKEIVATFINTNFCGGRHQRRLDKISAIEQRGD